MPLEESNGTGESQSMADEMKKREFRLSIAQTLLVLLMPVLLNTVGAVWYFGALNNRVATIEDKQKLDESVQVTEKELLSRDNESTIYRQQLNTRLDRMEDKMDRILEMQVGGKEK